MMETKEQKPWYHGVKWSLDIKSAVSSVFVTNEPGKHITSLPVGAGWWHDGDRKAAWLASQDGLEAQLIAAAPETATQRDALLSVQKQLVEALEKIAEREAPNFDEDMTNYEKQIYWEARANWFQREARAAILAAKASS